MVQALRLIPLIGLTIFDCQYFLSLPTYYRLQAVTISQKSNMIRYKCGSPNRNLARSEIWQGQIEIRMFPRQIPNLAKLLFSLADSGSD